MKILNFHDLGENGENACCSELLKYWPEEQIVSRTYDLDTEDPAAILLDSMVLGPYDLIVGTGFGGVLALLAGRATGVRTVLVNPMYPIQRYLPAELPDYKYGNVLIGYEHKKICWDTGRGSLKNVFLILGRDDDITDTERTPAYFFRGNSRFVEGGHFPNGEDFARVFGELTGGIKSEDCSLLEEERFGKESQALEYLKKWFANAEDSVDILYIYGPEQRQMTHDAKRLVNGLREELPSYEVLYLSADELPSSQEGLRETYRDAGLIVIDNIRESLLTEETKRSLWVACDEVAGHGGKVLLVSDETAVEVFGDDKDIMELIWSGKIRECHSSGIGSSRLVKNGELVIEMSWSDGRDRTPYSEYARHMSIDDVDTSDGHIIIYWSCPGEKPKAHALILFYADGKWFRDEEDGFCGDKEVASMVLKMASEKIIAQTDCTKHDLAGFWGWDW